jgi:hypothetical protein
MKKFMILYMAPVAAEVQMDVSPEEMKKGMEPWNAWFKKCGKAIVNMGAPLGKGTCIDEKGSTKGQMQVTGYTIIQVKDLEAAKVMLTDHPHMLLSKASMEILEIMPMNM